MSGPEQIAPAAALPLGGSLDAVPGGAAAAASRPAQAFPAAAAARALLVRRAMAQHSTLALDGIDKMLEAGHTDAALIQLEGLREAERLLAARIATAVRALMGGGAG